MGPTLKHKVLLALVGVLAACLAGELAIRSSDALQGRGFWSASRTAPARRVIPFRMFGFVPYGGHHGARDIASRHGELYPLEKPPGAFRIVCFGGSTTENQRAFEASGIHYPLRLQAILRERLNRDAVEVINVANSAYATAHALILLELDVLSWDPDLVILTQNFNDLLAMYFPDFTFDHSHKFSHDFYTNKSASRAARWPVVLADGLFQWSQLYWVLKSRLKTVREALAGAPTMTLRRRSYGESPDPRAAATFKRNLKSFVTLAHSNGIEVLLSTQPLQPGEDFFLRHMAHKPYNDVVVYPLHEEFIRHHRAYNDLIAEVAAEEGAWLIDMDQLLGGEESYFFDFIHFSRRGVEELAQRYADFLVGHGLIK